MINGMNLMKGGSEKVVDPQLWRACAGGTVRLPPLNSKVYYFPQGHAENAYDRVDFGNLPIPSMVLCRVLDIKYQAEAEWDEVYAKVTLIPLKEDEYVDHEYGDGKDSNGFEGNSEKTLTFAKTLTQSDANNGGGFSVPRYCAETMFPRLDYKANPPVQSIHAKDVHGYVWEFRHIYRGTPPRHLLTTGWSPFVTKKKLVARESIVFMRAENGDLSVGIRRPKRGRIGDGPEYSAGRNPIEGSCGYSSLLREDESNSLRRSNCPLADRKGNVTAESVIEAATLAIRGRPFEVVYYPRASTSPFCVKASDVRAAMRIPWCSGMMVRMAFEGEDSARISWYTGTVSAVNVSDPIRWPDSYWRLLQVAWEEPDSLQNLKRVNPWLVEMVSNVHPIPLTSFSPLRKKICLSQHPEYNPDYNKLMSLIPVPSFPSIPLIRSSPLSSVLDNVPVGLQGARHNAHQYYGLSSLGLHHYYVDRPPPPPPSSLPLSHSLGLRNEKDFGFLKTGTTPCNDTESKKSHIVLFGQLILTEKQLPGKGSMDTANIEKTQISSGRSNQNNGIVGRDLSLLDEGSPCSKKENHDASGLETGHCKVFMVTDNVGRTLDLSALSSYEELSQKLSDMFGIQKSEMLNSVVYSDASGAVNYVGNEPFSEFLKKARRLTILTKEAREL